MMAAPPMRSRVGLRFSPTDEELVGHYLMNKMQSDDAEESTAIPEIRLRDYEPWEIPGVIRKDPEDEACHFFSPCDHKYKGSLRFNRVTKAGFWKPTGKPRRVTDKSTKKVIGTKRYLVFHLRQQKPYKPRRTGYVMHEYEAMANSEKESRFLLYKLQLDQSQGGENREYIGNGYAADSENQIAASDVENQILDKQSYILDCFDELEPLFGPEDMQLLL